MYSQVRTAPPTWTWKTEIGADTWTECLCSMPTRSVSSSHHLIQHQVTHRHYSRVILHPFCSKKKKKKRKAGSYIHGSVSSSTNSGWKFFISIQTFMDIISLLIQKRALSVGQSSLKQFIIPVFWDQAYRTFQFLVSGESSIRDIRESELV